MLIVRNLCWRNVIESINLTLSSNYILGISGSSGIGKTSFLKCIKNFYNDWEGTITFNGQNISVYDTNIGYIFQENGLFPYQTVYENLMLAHKNDKKINEYLDIFNLQNIKHQKANTLSGGQKQRILIIRTLLLNPTLILMDEPTSALDENNKIIFQNLLKSINTNKIIIIVSHDIDFLNNVCSEIIDFKSLHK